MFVYKQWEQLICFRFDKNVIAYLTIDRYVITRDKGDLMNLS